MAIATYTDLTNRISGYLKGRTDLTDRIPEFITLAEKRINRKLRVEEMVSTATLTAAAEMTLPTDFLEADAVVYEQTPKVVLLPGSKRTAQRLYAYNDTGIPRMYRMRGASMLLHPTPQSAEDVTVEYYAEPDGLTSDNATNTIFPKYADVYLWAAMAEASLYLMDDVRAEQWDARAQAAMEEANKAAARRHARGARVSRAYGARCA